MSDNTIMASWVEGITLQATSSSLTMIFKQPRYSLDLEPELVPTIAVSISPRLGRELITMLQNGVEAVEGYAEGKSSRDQTETKKREAQHLMAEILREQAEKPSEC